jgi:ABC-type transport system involved in multi-copper enzyme maturation permease subunit
MNTLRIAWQTFTVLRRDRVFLPALVLGILIIALAQLAGQWGIEEYFKFVYDLGTTGFHTIGAVVAILWGTKMIADSRQEGSLEVELAAPVSRTTWLLGKFFGLCLALVLLGAILILVWQGLLTMYNFPPFEYKSVVIMAMLLMGWFVLAATAVFFAALTSQATALFSCLCMWLAGLVSTPIANVLSPTTPESTRKVVTAIARFWDLSRFNLGSYAFAGTFPSRTELLWIFAYGCFLSGALLGLACIVFSRRDLVA